MTSRQIDEYPLCLTLVRGRDICGTAAVLRLERDRRMRVMTLSAMLDEPPEQHPLRVVLLSQNREWTLACEPNGDWAARPKHLEELSLLGTAISAHWTVNGDMRFQFARAGVVERSFDPLDAASAGQGRRLAEEEGLAFEHPGRAVAQLVSLINSLTGVRLTHELVYFGEAEVWAVA